MISKESPQPRSRARTRKQAHAALKELGAAEAAASEP